MRTPVHARAVKVRGLTGNRRLELILHHAGFQVTRNVPAVGNGHTLVEEHAETAVVQFTRAVSAAQSVLHGVVRCVAHFNEKAVFVLAVTAADHAVGQKVTGGTHRRESGTGGLHQGIGFGVDGRGGIAAIICGNFSDRRVKHVVLIKRERKAVFSQRLHFNTCERLLRRHIRFRNVENLKAMVLLCCSNLVIPLPNHAVSGKPAKQQPSSVVA